MSSLCPGQGPEANASQSDHVAQGQPKPTVRPLGTRKLRLSIPINWIAPLSNKKKAHIGKPVNQQKDEDRPSFLEDKSHLLPTKSLFTPSAAYLSISWTQCFTLLKDSSRHVHENSFYALPFSRAPLLSVRKTPQPMRGSWLWFP